MLPLHFYRDTMKAKGKRRGNDTTATDGGSGGQGKHRRYDGHHTSQDRADSDKKSERHPLSVSLDDLQRQEELARRDEEDKRRHNKEGKLKCDFQRQSKDQAHSKKRTATSLREAEDAIDLSNISPWKKWTVVICFFGFLIVIIVVLILVLSMK
ncbi:hypothetical protein HOLleu_23224 [Holothuria leucospilota]|uniref:Uncharacterized protein n=1 Tax=Holothuria leucospilota TaxID=206669 RepID=A0A9Q1H5D9_HOLLE|nr:hypothetical protein HOLleu_23224 [Holothuria leucospilota]